MCDKEDEKVPFTKNHYPKESSKKSCEDQHQRRLNDISSAINVSKLKNKRSLPVDRFGRVEIDPSHPDYQYLIGDDDE